MFGQGVADHDRKLYPGPLRKPHGLLSGRPTSDQSLGTISKVVPKPLSDISLIVDYAPKM
jgi:hypothetical protein